MASASKSTLPRGMQHISRQDLFTSLPTRIQYLQEFLEFTSDDVAALESGQRYIKLVIPAIVNMVYRKLLRHDITARVFSTRDSRSTVDPAPGAWVGEDSAQIQHRKMFLRLYLGKLNSDPTKMEYWEYLDKVGQMHVGRGRRNPLHVDYIFLGACLGYIQDAMTEAILSHPKLALERKIAIVRAIGKVVWIQNDLLAKWHVSDGDMYGEGGDDAEAEPEPEGCLHGKRVLGESWYDAASGSRDGMERTDQSRCPFSGMGIDERISVPKGEEPHRQPPPSGIPRLHSVHSDTQAS